MKKILLLAAFGVAGLVSAKDNKEIESKIFNYKVENNSTKIIYCQEYSITTWCNTSRIINDTVCYEPTNAADKEHAEACMDENARLTNVFFCGRETSAITRDLSIY